MSLSRRQFMLRAVSWFVFGSMPYAQARGGAFVPPLSLAKVAPQGVDVGAYWVSEKLDGVRAYWDGQQLWSRAGLRLRVPSAFVQGWPSQALDGELWLGRGQFERINALLHRQQADDEDWRGVRYMVFDGPGYGGSFSERLQALARDVVSLPEGRLQLVEQRRFSDAAALEVYYQSVLQGGGEGLILHRADALHYVGRSEHVLKMKPVQDAEARVIGHVPGKGKYQGLLGALWLQDEHGRRFALGSGLSDALRREPPPVGTLVCYRYTSLTAKGLPRHARFYRIVLES